MAIIDSGLPESKILADSKQVDEFLKQKTGLKLVIDNREIFGWESFNISRSISNAVGTFSVTTVDLQDEVSKLLDVNAEVLIYLGSDLLMTGRIYKKNRSITATSTSFTLEGRDTIADIVDCAAIVKSNYWANARLETIAADICKPFDVSVVADTEYETYPKFSIQQGETAYAAIERACRAKGVLAIGNRFGNLTLKTFDPDTNPRTLEGLVLGKNILTINESVDYSSRFSDTYVKGQGSRKKGARWRLSDIQKVGAATDSSLDRYRPTILVSESKGVTAQVKKRAAWQAQVSAGRSKSYTVTVQGFRQKVSSDDARDPVWLVGQTINLNVPQWNVNEDFIIADISYAFSTSGSITTMTLRNPNIYAANPKGEVNF